MEGNTKERILEVALELFSEKGYEGSSIRELSERLGLTKGAMYKHFDSKEDLWNTLINNIDNYYLQNVFKSNETLYYNLSKLELKAYTLNLIKFTFSDKHIIMFRKALTIDQYRNARIASLQQRIFLAD